MYISRQVCALTETVSLKHVEPPPRIFSVLVHIGRAGGTYADALHEAGFRKTGVYLVLDRLMELGLVTDRWEASDKGGGARRMYRLTPRGEQVYGHLIAIDELLK